MKKYLGYAFIILSICFSFFRGKKQGELDCIDFNVLPIIANSLTIIVCTIMMVVGVILIKKKN